MIPQMDVFKDGVKIGATFPKRARQLVNKQKAEWTDETYSAINLVIDESKERIKLNSNESTSQSGYKVINDDFNDLCDSEKMVLLASKRVKEKTNFKRHTAIYLAGIPILLIIFARFLNHYLHVRFLSYSPGLTILTTLFIWSIIYFGHTIVFLYRFPEFQKSIVSFFTRSHSEKIDLEIQQIRKIQPEMVAKKIHWNKE